MIDMNKQYKYRNAPEGQELRRILCVDRNVDNFPVLSERKDGVIIMHTKDGLLSNLTLKDCFDLIEITKYDHIKKGDLVMVWDVDINMALLRTFIKKENGKALCENGVHKNCPLLWSNCELVQDYAEKYLK